MWSDLADLAMVIAHLEASDCAEAENASQSFQLQVFLRPDARLAESRCSAFCSSKVPYSVVPGG